VSFETLRCVERGTIKKLTLRTVCKLVSTLELDPASILLVVYQDALSSLQGEGYKAEHPESQWDKRLKALDR